MRISRSSLVGRGGDKVSLDAKEGRRMKPNVLESANLALVVELIIE